MDNKLKFIFSTAPDKTGVYLMRDSFGKVIYIGKAKSLKKRLLTYLGRDLSLKTQAMLSRFVRLILNYAPMKVWLFF